MNTIGIKYLISFLLISTAQLLLAQENNFGLTVEYAPNYSRLTNEVVNENFKIVITHYSGLAITPVEQSNRQ